MPSERALSPPVAVHTYFASSSRTRGQRLTPSDVTIVHERADFDFDTPSPTSSAHASPRASHNPAHSTVGSKRPLVSTLPLPADNVAKGSRSPSPAPTTATLPESPRRPPPPLTADAVEAMNDVFALRCMAEAVRHGDGFSAVPTTPVHQTFGPIRNKGNQKKVQPYALRSQRWPEKRKAEFLHATGWELVPVRQTGYRHFHVHEAFGDEVPNWIFIAPVTQQVFALGGLAYSLTDDYVDLLDDWHSASTKRGVPTMVLHTMNDHERAAHLTGRSRGIAPFVPDKNDSRTLRLDQVRALELVLRIAGVVMCVSVPWGIATDGKRHFVISGPVLEGNVSVSRSWGCEYDDTELPAVEPQQMASKLTDTLFTAMAGMFVNLVYPPPRRRLKDDE
ncbi:hypothetical protein Q8F55_001464 [Vanrija albida]|uniref:Uncharacterized protein n=1 Tax=Vanrija albida TaxID=181172 RepID=A0ABR3QG40_9TREE